MAALLAELNASDAGSRDADALRSLSEKLDQLSTKLSEQQEKAPAPKLAEDPPASLSLDDLSGEILGVRAKPLPPPARGTVLFPIVSENGLTDASNFGDVYCEALTSTSGSDRWTITGLIPAQRNYYYKAIGDARHGERDPVRINAYTHAWVEPGDFSGRSFELAAAIADRAVRYGLLSRLRRKYVIATGQIGRGGKVQRIGGFASKLKLIERDLESLAALAPEGIIFVCPRADFAEAGKDVADWVQRLSARAGLECRPIDDLAELNEWFVDDDAVKAPPPVAEPKPPVPPRDDIRPAPRPPRQVAPPPKPKRRWPWLVATGVGLAFVAGLYLAADHQSVERRDPIVDEQARGAIATLAKLGSAVRADAQDAKACAALVDQASLLTGATFAQFPNEHRQGQADLQQCSSRMAQSDGRLNELRAAVAALDPNLTGTVDRLAAARKAVTVFDEGRLSSEERSRLIVAGDRAQSRLAESDRRIAQLMSAHIAWRANGNAFTLRALGDGDRGLSDFDRSRNLPGLSEALRDVDAANKELAASAARWRTLQDSIDRATREPIEFYWRPLKSALDQITSLDRDLASQAQRQLLPQAQTLLTPPRAMPVPSPAPVIPPAPPARRKLDDFGTIPGGK